MTSIYQPPHLKGFSLLNQPLCLELSKDKPQGEGLFNVIWKVQDKNNGKHYAIKASKSPLFHYIRYEREMSANLNSLSCLGSIGDNFPYALSTNLPPLILFPWAEERFTTDRIFALTALEKHLWAKQLINAVIYLRGRNLVHTDITQSNILIHDGIPKLSDFGGLVAYEQNKAPIFSRTQPYYSPEMQLGQWNADADEWSMALILYQLFYQRILTTSKLIAHWDSLFSPIDHFPKLHHLLKQSLHPYHHNRFSMVKLSEYFH